LKNYEILIKNVAVFKYNMMLIYLVLVLLLDDTQSAYCHDKSSVCPSVTLKYRDHISWNTSKITSLLVSLGCSLLEDSTSWAYSQRNNRNFAGNRGCVKKSSWAYNSCNISETGQETNVTIADQ